MALRGSILLTDGTTHALSADNVVRYHIDETSTGGEAITIGDTRAAEYTLVIEDAAHSLTAAQLLGAKVTMEIGIDGTFDPLGVWTISRARISRQSATVDLSGADALSSETDALYVDGAYPATLGQILQRAADQAGLTLKNASFRNSGVSVASMPEWDPETNSVRAIIGYVAGCAGGFARIDRAGLLEIVPYNTQTAGEVGADYFATLNVGMGRSFAFNCLQVMHYGTNIYTRYAINSAAEDTAGNTLRISDNPLMTANIAQSLVSALTGMSGQAISADWVGDPTVQTGAVLTFVDTDGKRYPGIVTGQTVEIDGGLHMTTDAVLPETISATYATDTLYTPSGKVNITAIEGRLKVWAKNEIDLAVGGIEIGGTNLLSGTQHWGSEHWSGVSGKTIVDETITIDASSAMSQVYQSVDLEAGKAYTLSVDITNVAATAAGMVVHVFAHDANTNSHYNAVYTLNPAPGRYSKTFTVAEGSGRLTVYVRAYKGVIFSARHIQLEEGNKPSAWRPSPMDYSSGVQSGSDLLITKDVVRINTPELEINVSGVNGDAHFGADGFAVEKVSSPSVRKRYTGPTTLTVGGTPDGVSTFAALGDALAKLNDCHIPEAVAIQIRASVLTEYCELAHTTGAEITINGNGAVLTGRLALSRIPQSVRVSNLTIQNGGRDSQMSMTACAAVYLHNCKIVGSGVSGGTGLYSYMSALDMRECEVHKNYHALWLCENSRVYIENCTGSANTYALVLRSNARVGMLAKRPQGSISTDASCTMSADPGAGESATPSTPSATTTVTLTATNTRTHDGGSWYSGTNVLSQGVKDGTTFRGFMWFDTSAIAGKTIKSAAIRLYRRAGVGSGNPVKVLVGSHNASGPSGATNIVGSFDSYVVGMVDQKEELKASISVEAVQHIANGSAKGLYIHSDSSGYAQFDGFDGEHPPKLLVTYA